MSFGQEIWTVRVPASATSFSHQLAHVDAERLSAIEPELISKIWDPFGCPTHLLPYLAWALSVDVWDDDWSEATKRRVIAASPRVHRLKGTRTAVEAALIALSTTARITEWWETEPVGRRGTFNVTVFARAKLGTVGDAILSAKLQDQIVQTIRSAKPKSRTFDFQIAAGFDGQILAANRAAALVAKRGTMAARTLTTTRNRLQAANAFGAVQIVRGTMIVG